LCDVALEEHDEERHQRARTKTFRMKQSKGTIRPAAVFQFLLPSVKMKSYSSRGVIFERELHAHLMEHYGGYTVTGGSITGYWKRSDGTEECNEHRAYHVAVDKSQSVRRLQKFIVSLGAELGEKSIFCITGGKVTLLATTGSR
jgi:hypothetical protein